MQQALTRATAAWRGSNGERLGAAGISLGSGEFARELASAGIGPRLESIEFFTDGRRRKIAAVGRTSSAKWPLTTRYDTLRLLRLLRLYGRGTPFWSSATASSISAVGREAARLLA